MLVVIIITIFIIIIIIPLLGLQFSRVDFPIKS